MIKIKNTVYFFCGDEGYGLYVAEENFDKAKEIAIYSPELDYVDYPHELIEGKVVKRYNHRIEEEYIVKNNITGILSTQDAVDLGIAWFECTECGYDNLKIVDNGENYKCLNCGWNGQVSYY